MDPNDPDAYYSIGLALRNLGDYGRAIALFDRAIELDPNYGEAYINKGISLGYVGDYSASLSNR